MTVDFTESTIEMEAEESIQEWYGDITDKLDDAEQEEVASTIVDNYTSDKESRPDRDWKCKKYRSIFRSN